MIFLKRGVAGEWNRCVNYIICCANIVIAKIFLHCPGNSLEKDSASLIHFSILLARSVTTMKSFSVSVLQAQGKTFCLSQLLVYSPFSKVYPRWVYFDHKKMHLYKLPSLPLEASNCTQGWCSLPSSNGGHFPFREEKIKKKPTQQQKTLSPSYQGRNYQRTINCIPTSKASELTWMRFLSWTLSCGRALSSS